MFDSLKFRICYTVGGNGRTADASNDDFGLDVARDGNRLTVRILPKRKMELVHAEISCPYSFSKETSVLANGYQSWSLTKE